MREIAPGLYQAKIERPFGNAVATAAYFARRADGNILFYSSAFIEEHFAFMEQNGGVELQLVNHRDEASSFCDTVWSKFQAPLHCHILESEVIAAKCRVGQTFDSRFHQSIDLEVIPTPGHCPGSTCFLWEGPKNILFTGDTFYPINGVWSVAIADGKQEQMIESLSLLLNLEIDMIVPSLFIGDVQFQEFQTRKDFIKEIQSCIGRLERGAVH